MSVSQTRGRAVSIGAMIFLLSVAACLTSPDDVKFVRYFRPLAVAPKSAPVTTPARPPINLRRISAAGHLHEPIAWVKDEIEIGQYEDLRWFEPPQRIVERALEDALYVQREMRRGLGGDLLDIEVIAFEQWVGAPSRMRVKLRVVVEGERGALRQTFQAEAEIADDTPEALANAMGNALAEVIQTTADWIAANSMS